MSFLDTLKQWDKASTVADRQEFSEALEIFLSIEEPNSKIYFNIGCLHLLNEDLRDAEKVNFKYELQHNIASPWYSSRQVKLNVVSIV